MRTLWCSGSEKTTVFGLLNLHHCSRFQLLVSLSSTCLLIVLGPCHVPCLAVTVFCRLCSWAANTQQHILCVQLQQSRWWRPWHSLFLYLASLKLSRVTRDPICLPVCWPKVRAFSSDAQVSSDPPTNLIDYVNGFGHRLCCRSVARGALAVHRQKWKWGMIVTLKCVSSALATNFWLAVRWWVPLFRLSFLVFLQVPSVFRTRIIWFQLLVIGSQWSYSMLTC